MAGNADRGRALLLAHREMSGKDKDAPLVHLMLGAMDDLAALADAHPSMNTGESVFDRAASNTLYWHRKARR